MSVSVIYIMQELYLIKSWIRVFIEFSFDNKSRYESLFIMLLTLYRESSFWLISEVKEFDTSLELFCINY